MVCVAGVYQFFTPFICAVLSFAGSFIIYWIKDRDPTTREFERQTKRLQFWKALYDLQAIAPVKLDNDHTDRYRQVIGGAVFWIVAFPTKAARPLLLVKKLSAPCWR
jgi:hypothetical protein